jgi:uncharacterized protein (TIGR02246 family)
MTRQSDAANTASAAPNTEATRAVVHRFVEAWTTNDVPGVVELLAEDAVWQVPASIGEPLSGREAIAKQLSGGAAGKYVHVETVSRTVPHMIVDGEQAMVLVRLTAVAYSGAHYVNDYAWRYEVRAGLVRHIVEYADTLQAARLGFLPFTKPE